MPLVVAPQHAPQQREHLVEGHVGRVREHRRCFAPEIPEQPLLGDPLDDPGERAFLDPIEPAVGWLDRGGVGLAARLRPPQHFAEAMAQPPDETAWNRLFFRFGFINRFAVQLVPLRTDWDDEHLHRDHDSKRTGDPFFLTPPYVAH